MSTNCVLIPYGSNLTSYVGLLNKCATELGCNSEEVYEHVIKLKSQNRELKFQVDALIALDKLNKSIQELKNL